MCDLAIPSVPTFGSPILLPTEARDYELRGCDYNLLPSFNGRMDKDAWNFQRTFCNVIEQLPRRGLTNDQLRMKCFSHTLKEQAYTWWLSLPVASMTTWQEVH